MPQADDENTIVHSTESTAPKVIYLAERMKDRIAKNEQALQNAVPAFNLAGVRDPHNTTLANELELLTEYLGKVAAAMTEKVAKEKALHGDVCAAAILVRCHRKAEWIGERVAKLERKADKWKARAKEKA